MASTTAAARTNDESATLLEDIDTLAGILPHTILPWPIALAFLIRLAAWLVVPATRFASDEESYFQVGTRLLKGHQDVFWPPVTGWLIALIRLAAGSDSIAPVRAAWIVMDTACAAGVYALARRLGGSLWGADRDRAGRLARASTLIYALYLPAISHAQFATSEIPALLATLVTLLLVTAQGAGLRHYLCGGVMAGVACLTRPSLLPLLVLVPLAATARLGAVGRRKAIAFAAVGSCVVGAHVARNWYYAGEATIATNSAYNLFIGNRDMYAEDLNLFSPRATPEQIEFRRRQFSAELPPFTQTPSESQRLGLQAITDHPLRFARRAVGRLARVFVPKTDVLELTGGSARVSVYAPSSIVLLIAANVEWALMLFGGFTGLAMLYRRDRDWARLFAGVIGGALVLCLIAISKPRYSFVFDPLLIICATVLWIERRHAATLLTRIDRRVVAAWCAFVLWGWVAFAIFAVTSRSAL
jgi:hypothetical protein